MIKVVLATVILIVSAREPNAGELSESKAFELIEESINSYDVLGVEPPKTELWTSGFMQAWGHCWPQGPFPPAPDAEHKGYRLERTHDNRDLIHVFGDGPMRAGWSIDDVPPPSITMPEECKEHFDQMILEKFSDGHYYPIALLVITYRAKLLEITEVLSRDGKATISYKFTSEPTEIYQIMLAAEPDLEKLSERYRLVIESQQTRILHWIPDTRPVRQVYTFTRTATEYDQGWKLDEIVWPESNRIK